MPPKIIDHRDVAQQLDLLHFREEAPGMVFWHPRGFLLYRLLEEAVRRQGRMHGYAEIRTPQILRRAVWEKSGHWTHFREGMFHVEDQSREAAVKPVSCPGHIFVANRHPPSYRELPIRLCELGLVHRDEPSGTLHGLLRVRQFTQDDGHIFCTREQAEAEVLRFCRAVPAFYRAFGFERTRISFSTRPSEKAGTDESWDQAEAALLSVLNKLTEPYEVQSGGGAFYGPKLEFLLEDRAGRTWQMGTIQFDLFMPPRFGLEYVDVDGTRKPPVMLHRALYGSLERFMGILLEQHGTSLPEWLAPEQVAVLPVSPAQEAYAASQSSQLEKRGLRVSVCSEGSLSRRIALAHDRGVPFMLILGERESASESVTLRRPSGQGSMPSDVALGEITRLCAAPSFE